MAKMRNVCNTHWHTPPERVERIKMESSSIFKDSTARSSPLVSLVVNVGGHILTAVSHANLSFHAASCPHLAHLPALPCLDVIRAKLLAEGRHGAVAVGHLIVKQLGTNAQNVRQAQAWVMMA